MKLIPLLATIVIAPIWHLVPCVAIGPGIGQGNAAGQQDPFAKEEMMITKLQGQFANVLIRGELGNGSIQKMERISRKLQEMSQNIQQLAEEGRGLGIEPSPFDSEVLFINSVGYRQGIIAHMDSIISAASYVSGQCGRESDCPFSETYLESVSKVWISAQGVVDATCETLDPDSYTQIFRAVCTR